REYGAADGLLGVEGVKRHRSLVAGPGGRIWLSLNRGLSMAEPVRASGRAAPALVRIEDVVADGRSLGRHDAVDIPSGGQRIILSYTGLSLSVPERVLFRYRLDGFDRAWSDPVSERQAAYTNLGPGSYRFRVTASNSDGLWSGAEASIGFTIAPAYWQTTW